MAPHITPLPQSPTRSPLSLARCPRPSLPSRGFRAGFAQGVLPPERLRSSPLGVCCNATLRGRLGRGPVRRADLLGQVSPRPGAAGSSGRPRTRARLVNFAGRSRPSRPAGRAAAPEGRLRARPSAQGPARGAPARAPPPSPNQEGGVPRADLQCGPEGLRRRAVAARGREGRVLAVEPLRAPRLELHAPPRRPRRRRARTRRRPLPHRPPTRPPLCRTFSPPPKRDLPPPRGRCRPGAAAVPRRGNPRNPREGGWPGRSGGGAGAAAAAAAAAATAAALDRDGEGVPQGAELARRALLAGRAARIRGLEERAVGAGAGGAGEGGDHDVVEPGRAGVVA